MKILYSCFSKSWGGMEMFTIDSVLRLKNRGFNVELLCLPNSRIFEDAKRKNISVFALDASGYFNVFAILKLIKLISKNRYNLIHTQASKDLWTIVPALKFLSSDIPLFLTKQVGSFIVKKDFLHRFLYNRVTKIFAISNVIKKNVIDTCPINPERIELHFNGVDISKFNIENSNGIIIRKEFGINENDIVIGMLARFSKGKGHEDFLKAASELNKKYSNVKFLIVGEPSYGEKVYAESVYKLANELNLEKSLIFTGYRSDTNNILASMDIFAFPSHNEAFGIALVEAMAMEKPVVCSASDGILDINLDGETGLFFETKNYLSLTEKLSILIEDKSLREKMGKNARMRVIAQFDIELLTDKIINFYRQYFAGN